MGDVDEPRRAARGEGARRAGSTPRPACSTARRAVRADPHPAARAQGQGAPGRGVVRRPARAAASARRAAERPPLVGRDARARAARAARSRRPRRRGPATSSSPAPPGIGKTQLVEAMRAEAAGLTVLLATCEAARRRRPVRRLARAPAAADRRATGTTRTAAVARAPARAPSPSGRPSSSRGSRCSPPRSASSCADTPAVAALAPAFRADRLHDAVVRFLAASLPDARR